MAARVVQVVVNKRVKMPKMLNTMKNNERHSLSRWDSECRWKVCFCCSPLFLGVSGIVRVNNSSEIRSGIYPNK